MIQRPPRSTLTYTLFPYTTLFRSRSDEAAWSRGLDSDTGNHGHRPGVKGGYVPVPPIDSFQDMRSEMCPLLEQQGVPVEVHHHEVAGPGQLEIGTRFSTLVQRADWNQILKYTVHNVAHVYGKTDRKSTRLNSSH